MSDVAEVKLYSTGEVAAYLGVSQSSVQNYIIRGLLKPDIIMPDTRDGKCGRRKFKKSTVDDLAKKLNRERG